MNYVLFLTCLAASLWGGEATGPTGFFMIGDWGRDPARQPALHAQQRQVAEGMAKVAALPGSRPLAVLALGDNQYDGVADPADPIFRTAFEGVYASPALQVPFWAVLGNHEYSGSVHGQLRYAAEKRGSGRWIQPARYWSRVVELEGGAKAKFVFLDTSVFIRKYRDKGFSDIATQDPAAQLAWLDKELAEPGMAWRIAVGHHPIWSNGLHADSKDMARDILPVLRRHKVQIYLSGHDHHAEVIRKGDADPLQVIVGNSSEVRGLKGDTDSLHQGQYLGFGSLRLDGAQGAVVRLHDATGKVRYEVRVER